MTNLIVKRNGVEKLRVEIENVMVSGEEITLSVKQKQFLEIPLIQNQMYFITIENDNGNGIEEKPAIYRSYLFSMVDMDIQQQDELGNVVVVPTNQVSANQLLFNYV